MRFDSVKLIYFGRGRRKKDPASSAFSFADITDYVFVPALWPSRGKREEGERCPYCGSDELVITPEGAWVCARCGTVVRQAHLYEMGIESFEMGGFSFTGLEKARMANDTYEGREFFSVCDRLGFDYDVCNTFKKHAMVWFNRIVRRGGGVPLAYAYAVASALAFEEMGLLPLKVSYEDVALAVSEIKPWGMSVRVKVGKKISPEKIKEYAELVKGKLGH